ncbi:hypothetical protein Acife_2976 [Acidithiobacillus ferrivorans SS3]|uniref:Uncharacterized protein n=2 Tax=Acidithiobacillus ferrivorans TaxID=160808 RepID=G0JTT5_9PROT|nr:hypothetical protein Acife_2976 [Acidithiobacillus ferrivorans SS3]
MLLTRRFLGAIARAFKALDTRKNRAMLADELRLAAKGAAAFIAVDGFFQDQVERLMLAVAVWCALLLIAATIVTPEESQTTASSDKKE